MSQAIIERPFYLTLGALSESSATDLAPHFNHLPKSPYLDGEYRLRRFGTFNFVDGKVVNLPSKAFVQSEEFNQFQGNVERRYEDITPECYNSPAFNEMIANYVEQSGLSSDSKIEIHQLRILTKPGKTVEVAPEGVHQDGYNRIGMFMINYKNISGGELKVHTEKEGPAILKHLLKNGEYLLLNDSLFWHDAEDIHSTSTDQEGYYDLFVLTGTVAH